MHSPECFKRVHVKFAVISLSSSSCYYAADIGTCSKQVAGLHRVGPSTSLDKSYI